MVESRRVSVPIARVTILCMNAPHPPTHHAPHAPVQFARGLVHPSGPNQSPLALHVSRRRHPPSSAQGEPPGLGLAPAGERGEGDVDRRRHDCSLWEHPGCPRYARPGRVPKHIRLTTPLAPGLKQGPVLNHVRIGRIPCDRMQNLSRPWRPVSNVLAAADGSRKRRALRPLPARVRPAPHRSL